MRVLRTLALVALMVVAESGCKNEGTTALIATVRSVDEGIKAFTAWAIDEEARIADTAVAQCRSKLIRAEYDGCVRAVVEPKRAPIDKTKIAIQLYREALTLAHGAQTQNVAEAARAVTDALVLVGIKLVGIR